eukprot:scaffold3426_cov355-Prasinococcus_capsulatus_cf.AAC.14
MSAAVASRAAVGALVDEFCAALFDATGRNSLQQVGLVPPAEQTSTRAEGLSDGAVRGQRFYRCCSSSGRPRGCSRGGRLVRRPRAPWRMAGTADGTASWQGCTPPACERAAAMRPCSARRTTRREGRTRTFACCYWTLWRPTGCRVCRARSGRWARPRLASDAGADRSCWT